MSPVGRIVDSRGISERPGGILAVNEITETVILKTVSVISLNPIVPYDPTQILSNSGF